MIIERAEPRHLALVRQIVRETISTVYPRYYPAGAVAFFLEHHSDAAICADIEAGSVYLLRDDDAAVGTVTVRGRELSRLFVLPAHQGHGYGRSLLDFAERQIAEAHDEIVLDASLPAKAIYLKRGYVDVEYHIVPVAAGQFLCYDVMRKTLNPKKENSR